MNDVDKIVQALGSISWQLKVLNEKLEVLVDREPAVEQNKQVKRRMPRARDYRDMQDDFYDG